MTYWSGIVNETDLCHLGGTPHHLIDVLGIRSEEIDGLYDNQCNHMVPASNNFMTLPATYLCTHLCDLVQLKGAVPLMQYADNFYAGYPALTVHKYGDGLAFIFVQTPKIRFIMIFTDRSSRNRSSRSSWITFQKALRYPAEAAAARNSSLPKTIPIHQSHSHCPGMHRSCLGNTMERSKNTAHLFIRWR